MVKTKTARQPQDLTLRNNRARQNEIAELRHRLRETNDRVVKTRLALGQLIARIANSNASPISQTEAAQLLQDLVDQ